MAGYSPSLSTKTGPQVDIPLSQDLRDAWMLRIGGAIDVLGLELLVDRIFLADLHDGEDFTALRVDERDLLFGMDAFGKALVDWQCDRIGQKTPLISFISRHEPRQSSCPMNPSSGV